MTYRVILETRAVRDLDEATGWIAAQSAAAAGRWLEAIEARILSLARFPERCPRARGPARTAGSGVSCASWSLVGGTDATE